MSGLRYILKTKREKACAGFIAIAGGLAIADYSLTSHLVQAFVQVLII